MKCKLFHPAPDNWNSIIMKHGLLNYMFLEHWYLSSQCSLCFADNYAGSSWEQTQPMRDDVTMLQCNIVSHWLNPYPEWSLLCWIPINWTQNIISDKFKWTAHYYFLSYLIIWSKHRREPWRVSRVQTEPLKCKCKQISNEYIYSPVVNITLPSGYGS